MIGDTNGNDENLDVSSCEQVESDDPSSMINNTDGRSKDPEIISHEQVQTASMVYNKKGV